MLYLIESNEWRLIQRLAVLLDQKKARYHVQPGPFNDHEQVYPNAELFEVELRRTFMVKEYHRKLDSTESEHCQEILYRLCWLLNSLAWPRSGHGSPEGQAYPRLQALAKFLESTPGKLDLANGPNETLFRLPDDAVELRRCLDDITQCNDGLSRLLPQEPAIRPPQRQQQKKIWKKGRIRSRATFILETLFEHFRCGTPHEVLLKLTEDSGQDLVLPSLQLMLSLCPELEVWQEVQCDSSNEAEISISHIPDICTDIRQNAGQGKALILLVEKSGLFGAWAWPTSSGTGPSSKESLDQLIVKGAFKPPDAKALLHGVSSTKFSTREKRALAVKLGFCLMDFFDADLASRRIYFFDSSTPHPDKQLPYLSFDSKRSSRGDSYIFKAGHPTLLSFAKLLLEMDLGERIDLEISSHNSPQNKDIWVHLLSAVERLEEHRIDSYSQAIRGCLLVHSDISKAMLSHGLEGKDADAKIRKLLYKKVVRELELGLAESIPRPSHKRQRSESPPVSDRWDRAESTGPGKMTTSSVVPERTAPGYKRRRSPKPQQLTPPVKSKLALGETSRESDNNTAAEYIVDLTSAGTEKLSHNDNLRYTSAKLTANNESAAGPPDPFTIAIICALPCELDAVIKVLDSRPTFEPHDGEDYAFLSANLADRRVLLLMPPKIGVLDAGLAVQHLQNKFGMMELVLLVGICGGVASSGKNAQPIFLGDVIISESVTRYSHAAGMHPQGVEWKNISTQNAGSKLGSQLRILSADHFKEQMAKSSETLLRPLLENPKYACPGEPEDVLFKSTYHHIHRSDCPASSCKASSPKVCKTAKDTTCADLQCDSKQIARHRPSYASVPRRIHIGKYASDDVVMRNPEVRDFLAKDHNVLAFEMEAAGVWNLSNTSLVIKAVCDYGDSHKHKQWQNYAAACAAATAKAFIKDFFPRTKNAP